ncbi:MAG: MATE family efflux transporter [Halobacteriaceae archaeon]
MFGADQPNLTEGALARPFLRLAGPLVLTQFLEVAVSTTDLLVLGAFSAHAVAALGVALPAAFLLIAVGVGFATGGSILVAQYTGSEGEQAATTVAGQTLWLVVAVGVVVGAVGILGTRPLLSVMPAESETATQVLPLAAEYLHVLFAGTPVVFGFIALGALFRGAGDSRTPMLLTALVVAVNVALDPLLVFGLGPVPQLGVEGAAIANVAARVIGLVAGALVLARVDVFDVSLADFRPDVGVVGDITRLAIPSALEESASALALVALAGVVVTFEPSVVAAYGVGDRVVSLVFLPMIGVSQATNTVVGQNLGAERPARARRGVLLAIAAVAVPVLPLAVLTGAFPEAVAGLVLSSAAEAETVRFAGEFLRIAAVDFVFMGTLHVVLGGLRGAGNTRTALWISLATLWGLRLPLTLSLVFVVDWGPMGVWLGYAAGDVAGAVVAVAWFFATDSWTEAVVDTEGPPDDPAEEPAPED